MLCSFDTPTEASALMVWVNVVCSQVDYTIIHMVSLLFQNGDTKYHVLVSQKSTRFYRLYLVGIDSMCFINSILSTLSGRDRLDVFYQLDFIQVRIDSMCFYQLDFIQVRIDSMCFYPGKDRLDVFLSTRFYPGKDRLNVFYQLDFERIDSIPGRWGKRRVSRAAWYRGYTLATKALGSDYSLASRLVLEGTSGNYCSNSIWHWGM